MLSALNRESLALWWRAFASVSVKSASLSALQRLRPVELIISKVRSLPRAEACQWPIWSRRRMEVCSEEFAWPLQLLLSTANAAVDRSFVNEEALVDRHGVDSPPLPCVPACMRERHPTTTERLAMVSETADAHLEIFSAKTGPSHPFQLPGGY